MNASIVTKTFPESNLISLQTLFHNPQHDTVCLHNTVCHSFHC